MTAARDDGHREVVDVDVCNPENETSRTELPRDRTDLGLTVERLTPSDTHRGLPAAITRVFHDSIRHPRRVHAIRDLLTADRHEHHQFIAALIRVVCTRPNHDSPHPKLADVGTQHVPLAPRSLDVWGSSPPN